MANISRKERVKRAVASQEAGVEVGKLGREAKEALSIYNQLNAIGKQFTETIKEQSSFVQGITGTERKRKEIAEILNQIKEGQHDLDKKTLNTLKDVVKVKQKELELANAQTEAFERFFPNFGSMVNGISQTFKDIGALMRGPLGIVALFVGLVMIAMRFAKQINNIRADFGMSLKDAARLNIELKKATIAAKAFGLSGEQVRESFNVVAQKFGDVGPQAVQFSVDLARIARNTGLGVENTAELVSLYSALPGMSKKLSLNMIDTVTSMAEAAGVSRGILMKELAQQADLFASFVGKGEENLIKAAAAAKKVGMEFGGLVELGDGLLDVTERINKEQTLSTILGRQISLERFAQLNAAGELEAAQQELSNQLQGINTLSAQQTRFFADQLGVATADLVRLTGLRTDMPRAGGAFQNEEQKQTGLLSQIVENTKKSARTLTNEFGS